MHPYPMHITQYLVELLGNFEKLTGLRESTVVLKQK